MAKRDSGMSETASSARPLPAVYIHIGEPKTGTTFLQQLMFANRRTLAEQGVVLPGGRPRYHFRATQDLRGIIPAPDDPLAPFDGAWDRLVEQVLRAERVGIVSHEMLSSVNAEQADRAVRSFGEADVHVVLTVRDFATLLPAEWQESVKNRNIREYEDWLADVVDRESVDPDRRQWGFWSVHDTIEILRTWSRHIPPERVHVITMPPAGSSRTLLWERFAGLIGVDPTSIDATSAKSNASLSVAEVEFIRRINAAIPVETPDWFYMHFVKGALAHNAFAERTAQRDRLGLPANRDEWARKQADMTIAELQVSGYDIIGDLDELRPRQSAGPRAITRNVDSAAVIDASVTAVVKILDELRVSTLDLMASKPDQPPSWWLGVRPPQRGPIKRFVIAMSARYRAVRAVRHAWWRVANLGRRLSPLRFARGR